MAGQLAHNGLHAVLLAGSLSLCGSVAARDLTRLPIPEQEHDPLYVDQASIQRSGNVVRFRYVLDVPTLGPMSANGQYELKGYHSNEFDAVIDCARQTMSVESITAYAGVGATGAVTSRYWPTASERAPRTVVLKKGATWGYLYRTLCGPDTR